MAAVGDSLFMSIPSPDLGASAASLARPEALGIADLALIMRTRTIMRAFPKQAIPKEHRADERGSIDRAKPHAMDESRLTSARAFPSCSQGKSLSGFATVAPIMPCGALRWSLKQHYALICEASRDKRELRVTVRATRELNALQP
jgi:hypothetical protein